MLEKLNDTGKAYAVIGKGPLFRKGDIEARKCLIENNLVDAVITLPAKLMNFCPLPMIMLVLNKAKTSDDVLFINATEFQKEESGRIVLDDIERLAEEYHTRPVLTPPEECQNQSEAAVLAFFWLALLCVTSLKQVYL